MVLAAFADSQVGRLRVGWPFESMEGAVWEGTGTNTVAIDGAIPYGDDTRANLGILPLRPLAWGFTLNVVLYASVMGIIIEALRFVRGYLRRRRGLCPSCSYPAGQSTICSECGTRLRPDR